MPVTGPKGRNLTPAKRTEISLADSPLGSIPARGKSKGPKVKQTPVTRKPEHPKNLGVREFSIRIKLESTTDKLKALVEAVKHPRFKDTASVIKSANSLYKSGDPIGSSIALLIAANKGNPQARKLLKQHIASIKNPKIQNQISQISDLLSNKTNKPIVDFSIKKLLEDPEINIEIKLAEISKTVLGLTERMIKDSAPETYQKLQEEIRTALKKDLSGKTLNKKSLYKNLLKNLSKENKKTLNEFITYLSKNNRNLMADFAADALNHPEEFTEAADLPYMLAISYMRPSASVEQKETMVSEMRELFKDKNSLSEMVIPPGDKGTPKELEFLRTSSAGKLELLFENAGHLNKNLRLSLRHSDEMKYQGDSTSQYSSEQLKNLLRTVRHPRFKKIQSIKDAANNFYEQGDKVGASIGYLLAANKGDKKSQKLAKLHIATIKDEKLRDLLENIRSTVKIMNGWGIFKKRKISRNTIYSALQGVLENPESAAKMKLPTFTREVFGKSNRIFKMIKRINPEIAQECEQEMLQALIEKPTASTINKTKIFRNFLNNLYQKNPREFAVYAKYLEKHQKGYMKTLIVDALEHIESGEPSEMAFALSLFYINPDQDPGERDASITALKKEFSGNPSLAKMAHNRIFKL